MRQVQSDEVRRGFGKILNDVEYRDQHVQVLRYDTPAAVLVPNEWHKRFADPEALAQAVASALESAAVADFETESGDGRHIEIYVSQIAPIVARVLAGGEQ